MNKYLLFIDLTSNRQVVELPSFFMGRFVRAELMIWDLEGFDKEIDPGSGTDKGPYYIQLKFLDFLHPQTVTDSSHPEMVPIPVTSFNGWKPTGAPFSIPLGRERLMRPRFIVETYGPGKSPSPLSFPHPANPVDTIQSHLILWITIECDE